MYSAKKIQYRKHKLQKEQISNPLSYREINQNNNDYKNWKNGFILKNKIMHDIYKIKKDEENNLLSTNGMINGKRLNDNKKKINYNFFINCN